MILGVRAQGADAARGSRRGRSGARASRRGRKEGGRRGADRRGQAARERRRWPLRAGPEAARAARGGGERDAGLRGKRESGSRAGLLASGVGRELGFAGKEKGEAGWAQGKETGHEERENWAGMLGFAMSFLFFYFLFPISNTTQT